MARVTPQQASDKWVQRMQTSNQQVIDGVNAVTVAPGQKAAAQADYWLARVTASKTKFQTNVAAVTLQAWQADMIQKGVPRIASGATANQPKVTSFMTKFLPYLDQGVAAVKAMPKNNINDSIARAAAMIQWNAKFPG